MSFSERLTLSVEREPDAFAEALRETRLVYQVIRSSRRWVYVTDFAPVAAAEATTLFLHRRILPEMFLEHLDTAYEQVPDEDRVEVWRDNVDYLQQPVFCRGTVELLRPTIAERRGLSIEGWLRFRGRRLFEGFCAELARQGLKQLYLKRALQQFRSLHHDPVDELVVEGSGDDLVLKDADGRVVFAEYLSGHLDPHLDVAREDLALGILSVLQPERLELVNVSDDFRRAAMELRRGEAGRPRP